MINLYLLIVKIFQLCNISLILMLKGQIFCKIYLFIYLFFLFLFLYYLYIFSSLNFKRLHNITLLLSLLIKSFLKT